MSEREVLDLEYAALLHDIGQVSLTEPIPGGATVMAAPADQRRIAHDGAEIVRQTGVLDTVAQILEAQTTPYRQVREFDEELPVASRIIKVANAYEDLAGERPGASRRESRDGADQPRARLRVRPRGGRLPRPRAAPHRLRVAPRRQRPRERDGVRVAVPAPERQKAGRSGDGPARLVRAGACPGALVSAGRSSAPAAA